MEHIQTVLWGKKYLCKIFYIKQIEDLKKITFPQTKFLTAGSKESSDILQAQEL